MSKPDVIGSFEKNRRESVRVALDEFQGVPLLDMRVTVPLCESSGVPIPTKKGLSIRLEHLPALRELLAQAEERAVARGLLVAGERAGE